LIRRGKTKKIIKQKPTIKLEEQKKVTVESPLDREIKLLQLNAGFDIFGDENEK
jgi:hypothetical protein